MTEPTPVFDPIDAPAHYVEGRKFQPVEVIADWALDYWLGTAVKYISRAGRKPGSSRTDDIRKAIFYLQRAIRGER